jgi:diguanylate cyclase (GGDEF)-like protein
MHVWHTLDAWICPPGLPSEEQTPEYIRRVRISHSAIPATLSGYLFGTFVGIGALPLTSLSFKCVIFCMLSSYCASLILCHYRLATHAALLNIIMSALYCFYLTVLQLQLSTPTAISIVAPFLLPHMLTFIIFATSKAWLLVINEVVGIGLLSVVYHSGEQLTTIFHAEVLLIAGTFLITFTLMPFHRVMTLVDRSRELADLNQSLQARMQQISGLNHQLEKSLLESEKLRNELDGIFDSVQEGLAVYDDQLNLIHANRAAKAILTRANGEDQGSIMRLQEISAYSLTGEPFPYQLLPPVRVITYGETSPSATGCIEIADGKFRVLSIQAIPLCNKDQIKYSALTLYRDITESYRNNLRIEVLGEITHVCASVAEECAVAEEAVGALVRKLDLANAVIFLRTEHTDRLRLIASHLVPPLSDGWLSNLVNHDNLPAWNIVQRTFKKILNGGAVLNYPMRISLGSLSEFVTLHTRFLPLQFNGEVTGMLSFTFSESAERIWHGTDSSLFVTLADEIAASLHRAHLYEEARRMTLYDSLTGLRNHRALQDVLQQELALGMSQNLPVSLIMLDLDHFRRFNDTYGHDMGDLALRMVSKIIVAHTRDSDYAARYGGEEFVMLLPGAGAALTAQIAESVRSAIEQEACLLSEQSVGDFRLSVSVGYTTFPIHASAPSSLLKAAELALYSAKRSGRNCVVSYSPTLLQSNVRLLSGAISNSAYDANEIVLPSGADLDTVQALVTAIDLRDGYTAAHSEGVSRYAVAIGQDVKLPTEHIEALRLGGLVHDVGKIGIPDYILRKPGRLTDEEMDLMRKHAEMGEEILRGIEQLRHLLPLVRWHHERLDGSGYPDGLKGDEIPLLVRILAVADVYDAYTAERPYHPGRSAMEGVHFLQREAEQGRLDPLYVQSITRIIEPQGFTDQAVRTQEEAA